MLDLSPVIVSGPIAAARARAIWRDGTLAVFTAADQVQTFATTQPERVRKTYKPTYRAQLDDGGEIELVKACGCGGGGANPLGRVPRATLLAAIPASS